LVKTNLVNISVFVVSEIPEQAHRFRCRKYEKTE